MTNLLSTLEDLTSSLDEGFDVDILYLGYSKAFDTVPHKRLIAKLEAYGISGKILEWVRSFLSNRKQHVGVRHARSEWADVISGVPQGSVLGPILFVIYINDLPDIVSSTTKMFADDTKIYHKIDKNSNRGEETIQQDLNHLQEWSDTWLLRFNATKCKTMHMGTTNSRRDYHLGDQIIPKTDEEKDLGVIISSNCKPSMQCSKAAAKAMSSLGIIKRSFKYIDNNSFSILYKAYIRPHLEYCVQAWCPHLRKDINAMERIQRRATKMVPQLRHLTYENRMKSLGIISLENRRIRGDLIEAFKILKELDKVDPSDFFTLAQSTHATRGHQMKVYKPALKKNLNCRKYFFTMRVINHWNELPTDVVNAKTVNAFKNRLDKYRNKVGYGIVKANSLN